MKTLEEVSAEISQKLKLIPYSQNLTKRFFILSMSKDLKALEELNRELESQIKKVA